MTIWVSPVVRIPTTRSRVDCGFGLVILSFWPTMRFSNVDFPAFGLPTTVTMPARCIEERYSRRMSGDGTWLLRRSQRHQKEMHSAPAGRPDGGGANQVPATAYSPATSRSEYHRRCRA